MKKNNTLTKTKIEYFKLLDSYNSKESLYAPAIDAQLAINVLCQYLLGEDYYIVDPLPPPQADTIIVQDILHKYCNREVTKDYNKYKNARKILNQE